MIEPKQCQLLNKLGDTMHDSHLPVNDMLEILTYLLADCMSQMTDGQIDQEFGRDVAGKLLGCYVFHCTFEENDIVVQ